MYWAMRRTVKLGLKSLWSHRLRSTLTTLGIVFGVCSVIAMLAIGEGASRHAQAQIAKLGSRNIIIRTVKPPEDQQGGGQQQSMLEYGLTYADAERFRYSIPDAQVVVPNRVIPAEAWYRNRKLVVEVLGTVPWYPELAPVRIIRGRFLSSIDLHYDQGVCVIDERIAKGLFAFDDPLGQNVKISGDYYRVVGIITARESIAAIQGLNKEQAQASQNKSGANVGNIYIPLTTARTRFGEISLQVSGGSGVKIERVELQEIIVKVSDIARVLPTQKIVDALLKRFHKKEDYKIIVPLSLLEQARNVARIFSIVLGSIAAISLLVGGIGIMNIMLASVSERTREIGVRRALGAKRRDIIIQFLTETVLLTVLGGLLGIILGIIIPFVVSRSTDMPTVITATSLILAFGISGAVGLTFGLYPAWRAANVDPIESLRHE